MSLARVLSPFLLSATQFLGTEGYAQESGALEPLNLRSDLAERIVSDESFRKRFSASYGVLPEREPPLTEVEVTLLQKLGEMFRVNSSYAQTMLESLITDDSQASASFNYLLANLYYENESYLLAEEEYQKAIDKFPDFQRAWTNLAMLKLRVDDYPAALKAFARSIELGNVSADTYGKLAYCHFALGNYMSSEAAYTLAIMNDPGNVRWVEGKVEVYMESRRFAEASRLIEELLREDPLNPIYWLTQSNAYLALGETQKAARNIEIVQRLGQADTESLLQLGELYASIDLNPLAVRSFQFANQGSEELQGREALLLAALNMCNDGETEAASDLLKVVESQSSRSLETDLHYLRLKATLSLSEGDEQQAIKEWRALLEQDPLNGECCIQLARLYLSSGDRDRAYLMIQRSAQDNRVEFQSLMFHAKMLVEDKRFDEALPLMARALKLNPSESLQQLHARVQQANAWLKQR